MIFIGSLDSGCDAGARSTSTHGSTALEKWTRTATPTCQTRIDDRNVLERYNRMDLDRNGLLNQSEWERHCGSLPSALRNAVGASSQPGRGDLTEKAVVWKYRRGTPYVNANRSQRRALDG
jgi:hypothetical protein